MNKLKSSAALAAITLSAIGCAAIDSTTSDKETSDKDMSFFITSDGNGDGANFGGLEGADAHCTTLAEAAGSSRSWAAYLSTNMVIDRSSGTPDVTDGVSARDRIGTGPWYNANGILIANDIDALHSASANINMQTGLDESGNPIKGRGEQPNEHDILTGSDSDGHFSTAGADTTCGNWTSNAEGSAIVGHHDRVGLNKSRNMVSWNSSHGSAGCGEEDLPKTGGAGLLYCFATD